MGRRRFGSQKSFEIRTVSSLVEFYVRAARPSRALPAVAESAFVARAIGDRAWVADGAGVVQTDQLSDPAPDGARGHHTISVQVS